jgi:hypothetical protein
LRSWVLGICISPANGSLISRIKKSAVLELAVIDRDGPHTVVFPCRRVSDGCINATNELRVDVWFIAIRVSPEQGKYPPAEPGALVMGPLEAACGGADAPPQ